MRGLDKGMIFITAFCGILLTLILLTAIGAFDGLLLKLTQLLTG